MKLLVEVHGYRSAADAPQVRVADIADDGEHPRAAVIAAKPFVGAIRAEARLLHGVLGGMPVAKQPACEVVRGVEMRQENLIKSGRHR